ncbi:MAG: hypothetical protein JNM02_05365 [Anaerolineales bacterium]|nr:hypothetical protein [Anaerolineales bacterium]
MSKRVVIAMLISLVVIVAAFTSVRALGGVLRKAEANNTASMSVNNQVLGKKNPDGAAPYFFDDGMDSGHDCGSNSTIDY